MSAKATQQVDDERVRITRWDFQPGDDTGFHTHEMPYVIVPLTSGTVLSVDAEGNETPADMTEGVAYSRPDRMQHNVVYTGTTPFAFIEIEIKA